MIKKIVINTQQTLDDVTTLWLEANLDAHKFISASYWLEQLPLVKEQLPYATLYGYYDQHDVLLGFIGLNNTYVEGLFVKKAARNQSIGKQLLSTVKIIYSSLYLHVFCKNQQAVRFYLANDFKIIQTITEDNGETSYKMLWVNNE